MYFDQLLTSFDQARQQHNSFHNLMRARMSTILFVGNLFDSFVIEADGILTEQIYGEFYQLNLSSAPRIASAYTKESAMSQFNAERFDVVILTASLDFEQSFELSRLMKAANPSVPILLLVINNAGLERLDTERPELRFIDRVFVWNSYSKLFVGMLKYLEDLKNVENDVATGLVRVILLIEDSVRYYSRYLPMLYRVIIQQTQDLIENESAVETYKLLRLRARPKLLLATSWEEAMDFFTRYEKSLLCVISDLVFSRGGKQSTNAGIDFFYHAQTERPGLPYLIQSSEVDARRRVAQLDLTFADKASESIAHDVGVFLGRSLGFGPFVFRTCEGTELGRAATLDEFISALDSIPNESLLYHADNNDFSTWLLARGEIAYATVLRSYRIQDFSTPDQIRNAIMRIFFEAKKGTLLGMIPEFNSANFQVPSAMVRLANGSAGGKGRGILFLRSLLDHLNLSPLLGNLHIEVPRTAIVGIDEFEDFLEAHEMWGYAFYRSAAQGTPQPELEQRFLSLPLSQPLRNKLAAFVGIAKKPLVVRASGLFEDMPGMPLAGVYASYFLPNNQSEPEARQKSIEDAIKLVYASLFSLEARQAFAAAGFDLEEERMAVLIQEAIGQEVGDHYLPDLSGIALSKAQGWKHVAQPGVPHPVTHAVNECVTDTGLVQPTHDALEKQAEHQSQIILARGFCSLVTRGEFQIQARQARQAVQPKQAGQKMVQVVQNSCFAIPLRPNNHACDNVNGLNRIACDSLPPMSTLFDKCNTNELPLVDAIDLLLDVASSSMSDAADIEFALMAGHGNAPAVMSLLQLRPQPSSIASWDQKLPDKLEPGALPDTAAVTESQPVTQNGTSALVTESQSKASEGKTALVTEDQSVTPKGTASLLTDISAIFSSSNYAGSPGESLISHLIVVDSRKADNARQMLAKALESSQSRYSNEAFCLVHFNNGSDTFVSCGVTLDPKTTMAALVECFPPEHCYSMPAGAHSLYNLLCLGKALIHVCQNPPAAAEPSNEHSVPIGNAQGTPSESLPHTTFGNSHVVPIGNAQDAPHETLPNPPIGNSAGVPIENAFAALDIPEATITQLLPAAWAYDLAQPLVLRITTGPESTAILCWL